MYYVTRSRILPGRPTATLFLGANGRPWRFLNPRSCPPPASDPGPPTLSPEALPEQNRAPMSKPASAVPQDWWLASTPRRQPAISPPSFPSSWRAFPPSLQPSTPLPHPSGAKHRQHPRTDKSTYHRSSRQTYLETQWPLRSSRLPVGTPRSITSTMTSPTSRIRTSAGDLLSRRSTRLLLAGTMSGRVLSPVLVSSLIPTM